MEAQKRPGFQLDRCAAPQRKKAFQVPKASELATWKATARAPSDVSRLLDVGYVFGIDIETHDWVEHRATKASIGQYGFYCMCDPEDFDARIVQIGWSMGSVTEPPIVKEFVVQPVGFRVAHKAEKYHGISHEKAELVGKPLREVLQEFLDDVRVCSQKGGRVAIHHLEFDAGIHNVLRNAHLGSNFITFFFKASDQTHQNTRLGGTLRPESSPWSFAAQACNSIAMIGPPLPGTGYAPSARLSESGFASASGETQVRRPR